jgi:hypothetical protein
MAHAEQKNRAICLRLRRMFAAKTQCDASRDILLRPPLQTPAWACSRRLAPLAQPLRPSESTFSGWSRSAGGDDIPVDLCP